ncbi:MAG: sulfatase/phosphatase domain-containing protein, partial [Verrucomicrobiota bacterium]|nr:sulfatase/phosphatase domain-containing protein [Verrucomicrobiota bacterium]
PAGTHSEHISAFWDFLPTMAELAGEPINGRTDGLSMLPTLIGEYERQKEHRYLYWELYEGRPNCGVRMGKWKGLVQDRRKGMEIELYDLDADEAEERNVAHQYPEVVDQIRKAMLEAHEPSAFWDKNNKPLYNAQAACDLNAVTYVPRLKKKN